MSLIKQLWIAITLVLTLAFGGAFAISTVISKHYFEKQLQTKNNDNANSLALSMTQLDKDPVTIDLIISAQFDTGNYQYIYLIDPNGNVITERINQSSKTKAPGWFVKLIPLQLQPGVADIQDAWSQYGTVKVMSDSNIAYDRLWDYSVLAAMWTLALAMISGLGGSYLLRKILRPLGEVVEQAQSIGENRFITISVPKTKEFKAVVNAMNALSNRVKKNLSEESARLDVMRLENNFDHVTTLMNHDYFINSMNASISRTEYFHEGVLIISRLNNLAAIDQKLGYKETNNLLKHIADNLLYIAKQHHSTHVGRLNGTDFALFCDNPVDSYHIGSQVQKTLENMSGQTERYGITAGFVTVASKVTNHDSAEKTIRSASKFLDSIGSENSHVLHLMNQQDLAHAENPQENEWRTLLNDALNNKRIKLESYPTINQAGEIIHFESPVRLQLKPDGKWLCAGEFITWAHRFNLMARLDELVFETAVNALNNGAEPIGLNISANAICSQSYIGKVVSTLKDKPQIADRLYFEIPEQDAFDHLEAFHEFCNQVRVLGCRIGIEHVGARIARLGELHDIGLYYMKIDASIIRNIDINEANKTLLRGLCMIAHSIGVIAIAEGVQTVDEMTTLLQIGMDGMTGTGVKL